MIEVADKPWIASNLREVAEFFGVKYQTVNGDWRAGGMPGSPGKYDLSEIYKWKVERPRDPSQPTSSQLNLREQKLQAETALLVERERRAKLENDQTEGNLYHKDDVERHGAEFALRLKGRFEGVPDELEMIFPAEQRAMLKHEVASKISLILREISQWEPFGDV